VETVYAGQAIPTDTPIWTGSAWGPAVDSSIATYPFDLRAAESLMNQAGFTRGQDGFYRNSEGRLPPIEVITITVPDKIQSAEVVAEWFKTAGVDSTRKTIPAAQTQDNEVRSVYPGVLVNASGAGESALINLLATTSISSASNRWVGSNRGGWSNPEYDRLLTIFSTTLDRNERMELVRSMLKIYSEEMPLISTFFSTGKDAMLNELKGPVATAPEANMPWNIQEWYFE
jgi:peptide/nickel transport system substrate-binding protein